MNGSFEDEIVQLDMSRSQIKAEELIMDFFPDIFIRSKWCYVSKKLDIQGSYLYLE